MKKFILLVVIFLCANIKSEAVDFYRYCANEPAQKTVSGALASVSGFNFMTRNLIEFYISRALKKELNADFKVNIKNFYGSNILNGEFKDMTATAKQANLSGFYISDISAQTMCEYNHITHKNDELQFVENFLLKFSSQITQDDLNKTVSSDEIKKVTDRINQDEIFSSMFSTEGLKLEINNNKIFLKYKITPVPALGFGALNGIIKPLNIVISSDITASNGKLKLYNMKLVSKKSSKIPNSIVEILNPLKYNIKISKNKRSKLYIENAQIRDNIVYINGIIYVPKD